MAITVNTNQYQFSHGRKPRGYGGWFFYRSNTGNWIEDTLVWGTGTYSEMKKLAIAEAKIEGITEIIVGS